VGENTGDRLESWKEIAAYLQRDVRTVQRWEKREGLPVHRHAHDRLASIYAIRQEIDTWKDSRRVGPKSETVARPRQRVITLAALAMVAVAGTAAFGFLYFKRTRLEGAIVSRLWAGPEVNLQSTPAPDGKYVLYGDWQTSDLCIRYLATGETRRLTDNRGSGHPFRAAVSRDGRHIAFGVNVDGVNELRVIASDGSDQRTLFRGTGRDAIEPADWSPDGRSIVATIKTGPDRSWRLVILSAGDGSATELKTLGPTPPDAMFFSPDGNMVAYDLPAKAPEPERDIFVLNVAARAERAIVSHPAHDVLLGWHPEGAGVLFASDRTGDNAAWFQELNGGEPVREPRMVRAGVGPVFPMGFTRDGRYFYGLWTSLQQIKVVSLDANIRPAAEPETLKHRATGTNLNPAWSPDGAELMYSTLPRPGRGQASGLLVRSVATGVERRLSPSLRLILPGIRWSPDGRSALLSSWDEQSRQGLYQVDLQTGAVKAVAFGPHHIRQGEWSPDGKTLFYNRNDTAQRGSVLVARNTRTGVENILAATPTFARMELSRDGRMLAFIAGRELSVVPASGGGPPRLLHTAESRIVEVTWMPDGAHLLFAPQRLDNSEWVTDLWSIPAAGGPAQKLNLVMGPQPQMRVHPNSARLAYNTGRQTAEIWSMANFLR